MTTLEGERTAELDPALLTEARERLAKADSRAGLTLATLGAALTALLGAITAGVIAPGQYPAIPQLLVWSGCAACAPALVLLGLAAQPRPGSGHETRLESLARATSLKYRRIRLAMLWGAAFLALTLAGTLAGTLA
ncbi:hypothetical protein [Streptomyces sp. Go-475]|uniref:hypothetical protein n=1 Tax=Streptomyces sp. Go-475 TaxID=2072505 RepID=UPI000DF00164|nr:hypothetical protein [Streptomyces sp. Go-475]AXE87599.1 hypothetical protein C1703_21595 [Streptomyces sp. Go-475]